MFLRIIGQNYIENFESFTIEIINRNILEIFWNEYFVY